MLRITLERRRQGLSQHALATLTGIHPATISQLEGGKVYPSPGWKRRLAEALKVSEYSLFEEVDDAGQL